VWSALINSLNRYAIIILYAIDLTGDERVINQRLNPPVSSRFAETRFAEIRV